MSVTAQSLLEALEAHTNVLLYGPPGTGKTHLMEEVAEAFLAGGSDTGEGPVGIDSSSEHVPLVRLGGTNRFVRWVTFHQSYSYEDFVIGLRPDPSSDKLLGLIPVAGVLLELAAFAAQPGHAALLVIDEINRGNVSRIFGEFITLLEPEKRIGNDGKPTNHTVFVHLPYTRSGVPIEVGTGDNKTEINVDSFSLPKRIYTLASMNSVDKAIAPLDTALRRRFYLQDLLPTADDFVSALRLGISGEAAATPPESLTGADDVKRLGAALVMHLNAGIADFLGPDFCLGPWYLKDLARDFESTDGAARELASVWDHSILPQLLELFQGQSEQLAQVLRLSEEDAGWPVRLLRPAAEDLDLGASPHLVATTAGQESTLAFLQHVAAVTPQVA
jgi:5-methylcytosine-specific restriction enzyme B